MLCYLPVQDCVNALVRLCVGFVDQRVECELCGEIEHPFDGLGRGLRGGLTRKVGERLADGARQDVVPQERHGVDEHTTSGRRRRTVFVGHDAGHDIGYLFRGRDVEMRQITGDCIESLVGVNSPRERRSHKPTEQLRDVGPVLRGSQRNQRLCPGAVPPGRDGILCEQDTNVRSVLTSCGAM